MVSSKKSKIKKEIQMIVCLTLASVIMAFNLNSFVAAGGLFPSGFSGLTISPESFLIYAYLIRPSIFR